MINAAKDILVEVNFLKVVLAGLFLTILQGAAQRQEFLDRYAEMKDSQAREVDTFVCLLAKISEDESHVKVLTPF